MSKPRAEGKGSTFRVTTVGTILFAVVAVAAVLGALVVRLHPMDTGMLGPYAGAAAVMLASGLTFAAVQRAVGTPRAVTVTVALVAFAAASELCGILTGIPFGQYRYTGLWWPSIMLSNGSSYPLFVPLAWLVFIVACFSAASLRTRGWTCAIVTGLLAAFVDIGMEPVMTGPVGFWTWRGGIGIYSAPLQNFVGWFLTGFLAATILLGAKAGALSKEAIPRFILFLVVGLTIVIGLIYAKWEALVGLPIFVALLITSRGPRATRSLEAS